jgi:hypothetical protein
MIVQETNEDMTIPDDNEDGGMIVFDFEKKDAEYVYNIGLLDVDYKTSITVVYRLNNGKLTTKKINVPLLGDNSFQLLSINIANVKQIKITMQRSAAVTSISYCPPVMPKPAPMPAPKPAPTSEPTPSDPTPSEPTPSEPTEPMPSEPTPSEPTPSEPTP